jgi:hypothetical protein
MLAKILMQAMAPQACTCTVVEVPVVEETKYNKIQSLELL